MAKVTSEEILEVRFKPNPEVLDYRGALAKSVSDHMGLSDWQVDSNRMDIATDDRSLSLFVSFRNFGLVSIDSVTSDFFRDKAVKFTKFLLQQTPFSSGTHIERIGVRSRFGTSSELSFKSLVDRYTGNFVGLTDNAKAVLPGKIVDIGIPFHVSTDAGTIHVHGGPMLRQQLGEFFPQANKQSFADVNVYTDLDYWVKPIEPLRLEDITRIIKHFAQENRDLYAKIIDLLLKD